MTGLEQIFAWFGRGKTPTENHYRQTFSSFWHKSEKLPIEQVFGLREQIDNVTINFKGYYTSSAALQEAYPQRLNKKDWYAYVGTPYPGTVYKVSATGGPWTDTGQVPPMPPLNLNEYIKSETMLNVSQLRRKYDYASRAAGRADVPETLRAMGQVLIYRLKDRGWKQDIFNGSDLSEWNIPERWKSFSGGARVFDGGRADTKYGGARTIACGGAGGTLEGELVDCEGADE